MDWITEAAAVLLAGLAFTLSAIGGIAASQYSDRRLGLVAAGLALIGTIGALGVLHELSPAYGGPFAISLTPLVLLLVAVALVYLAVVTGAPRPARR